MAEAWRIFKTRHAATAFDGEGARVNGGRWNSVGVPMVYTAATVSLAMLEMLVHLDESDVLLSYSLSRVRFEDTRVTRLDRARLPDNWKDPSAANDLRAIGDAGVASGASVILEVPSAIVENESCYLINLAHPDFPSLVIDPPRPFTFDERLFEF